MTKGSNQIWLCEGEADCICALSHGLKAMTATGGAGTWKPEWNATFKGLDVVICYDADQKGWAGAHKAGKQIVKDAARVRILMWPGCMLEPDTHDKPYWARLPQDHGQDLTDFFVTQKLSFEYLHKLADQGEVIEPPAPDPTQDEDPGQGGLFRFKAWSDIDQSVKYRPMLLVEEILSENKIATDRETNLTYLWSGAVWRRIGLGDLKALVMDKLGMAASRNRVNEAAELLVNRSQLPEGTAMNQAKVWCEEDGDEHQLLCLQNGMLDLDTGEILPHDPKYLCTYGFPWAFDPANPVDCPNVKRFLFQTVAEWRVIREVQEFFGYCLWPRQSFKKAMLLIGPGDEGKSVLLRILRHLVGPDNTSAVNMTSLEDQFQRVLIHDKSLNVFAEASANFFSSDYFKAITGGDPVTAAYKHQDGFTFVPRAKLVFSANRFPRVADNSQAFFRRVLPVKFTRQFRVGDPDHDPDLWAKLEPELPGVFCWAVVGLFRLRRRGGFAHCKATMDYLNEYRYANNHVVQFIEEACVLDPLDSESKSDFFAGYVEWAKAAQYKPMPNNRFFTALKEAVPQVGEERPRGGGGERQRFLTGIRRRSRM